MRKYWHIEPDNPFISTFRWLISTENKGDLKEINRGAEKRF
jgi:hypothetical protein